MERNNNILKKNKFLFQKWIIHQDIYPFHIVEFVTPGKKPKVRRTDVVATKWLVYNQQKKKWTTRYPSPPYDENTSAQLNLALQNLCDAPSTWPMYTVKPRGKAGIYLTM